MPLFRLAKVMIIALLGALFITNDRKKSIILLILCTVTLYWPLLITPYGGLRFFYESLPLIATILALLIYHSRLKNYRPLAYAGCALLVIFITLNGLYILRGMKQMMRTPQKVHASLMNLKQNTGSLWHNRPVFLFNAPKPLMAIGVIQALQLYNISTILPHYFFRNIIIKTNGSSADIKKFLRVHVNENGLRFYSLNKDIVWFLAGHYEPNPIYLDKMIVSDVDTNNRIGNISLIFKPEHFDKNVAVAAWFYYQDKFLLLA